MNIEKMSLWWTIWLGAGLGLNALCPIVCFFSAMLVASVWVAIISIVIIGTAAGVMFFALNQSELVRKSAFVLSLKHLLIAAHAMGMSAAVFSLLVGFPLMTNGIVLPVLGFMIACNVAVPTGVFLAYTFQKMYHVMRQVNSLATIS